MLQDLGFKDIETKEDAYGKKRMMKAMKQTIPESPPLGVPADLQSAVKKGSTY